MRGELGRSLHQVRTPFRRDRVVRAAAWRDKADVAGAAEAPHSDGTVATVDGEEARLIRMSVLQQGSTSETHRPSPAWHHARYHACVRLIASLAALIVEDKKVDVFGALR